MKAHGSLQTRQARDRNYAFYVQDSWKPTERLTANLGNDVLEREL